MLRRVAAMLMMMPYAMMMMMVWVLVLRSGWIAKFVDISMYEKMLAVVGLLAVLSSHFARELILDLPRLKPHPATILLNPNRDQDQAYKSNEQKRKQKEAACAVPLLRWIRGEK